MNQLAPALLDGLSTAIAVVNHTGGIDYSNACFTETFGGQAGAWISAAARSVGGERGWLQGFFVAGDEPRTIDVEFSGRTYRVDQIVLGALDPPAVALTFEDVTRQREIEQAKSDFTSMIVHDLRGPLSGIQGTLEFILNQEGTRFDAVHEDLLLEASRESERMMSLINELLDFSKIESGNFEIETEPVRLSGVLKRAVHSLQSVAVRDEMVLLSGHSADLPVIHGSIEKLTQAIINLISNSLKFTPKKGVIAVGAQLLRKADALECILVTVTDTGIGMKHEDLEKIFEKYKQSKSKSLRGGGGTGLGLYIVKQIIEAHGGEVQVSSIQGVGTSMVLRLPLKRAS
ncbi:MAG TPA: HAMP domain-containing sensor histidine kinase [Thermoanaerobaculia bacterium]|nr:HAMP domain-containing sensor histidine kinase [Thermoanaerobaculia bacterium]